MDSLESQNARDARIERLWKQLDTSKRGELDLAGLREGLKKIDHPLKNADDLLQDVMKAVDSNGDGKIQYEEFRTFVEHAERELLNLFHSIDRDNNGKLDKSELRGAFTKAGLAIPSWKLDQFFEEVDTNHDGVISFDEWRNFLLFLPGNTPELNAIMSYYSSTVALNAEGDSFLRDDTVRGLGRLQKFLTIFFGSIIQLAIPTKNGPVNYSSHAASPNAEIPLRNFSLSQTILNTNSFIQPEQAAPAMISQQMDTVALEQSPTERSENLTKQTEKKFSLTHLLPDPGYFVAGGIAGVVSRTATAPLDRLKVYLIAHTGVAKDSIEAVKKGEAMTAVKQVGRPLVDACKELWKAGGMRSLFAGNGLNVLKVMPESAIKFGSYEGAKRALSHLEGHRDPNKINPYSKFIAGGLGGMVSQLCVYPLDTLKFRMQCNVEASGLRGNALIIATAKQMGFRSSYRGLTMGLVGMFPYSAIDLGTYEFLKAQVISYKSRSLNLPITDPTCLPGSFGNGVIGAFSGMTGASLVYPINVLRTRLQAQGTVSHPQTYDGVVDCLKKTISNEGIRGLFKGITPNLLKVVPAVSITYVVYEDVKRVLKLR